MIKSQFNYCPLVLMFCWKQFDNLINRINERNVSLIYGDQRSSYQNFLGIHKEFSIYQRNLKVLMTEIYKTVNGLALIVMNSLFAFRNNELY